jgi:hypothetical protein
MGKYRLKKNPPPIKFVEIIGEDNNYSLKGRRKGQK